MPFADLGDVQLFYTDDGMGDPPFLFVHGYACDSHDWSWQLADFVERHRVVAVDLRGHGRSSAPDRGYDHITFANDLAALLDRLACGPVIAVGHSLGALVVSTLAIEHPRMVRAVVSIDPAYLMPGATPEAVTSLVAAFEADDPASVAQAILGSCYSAVSPPWMKTWHRRRVAGMPPHVLREAIVRLMTDAVAGLIGPAHLLRRRCPVLAMYSAPALAVGEAQLFADDRSRTVTFEGSGHWLHQERPAEVNAIVSEWLASL